MKNFEEFKEYFNKNYSEELASKSANIAKEQLIKHAYGKTKLNMEDLAINLSTAMVVVNIKATYDILEKYHDWLHSETD